MDGKTESISYGERERRDALARGDALAYYLYCVAMYVDDPKKIENLALYEKGSEKLERDSLKRRGLEINVAESKSERQDRGRKRVAKDSTYADFLMSADEIIGSGLDRHTGEKVRLLTRYFPNQLKNKQKLGEYEPVDVGAVFDRMVRYAEKRVRGMEEREI